MTNVLFGDPKTVTGGEGPKYYTTYRISLDKLKPITNARLGGEIIGEWLRATIIKTRTGPSYRSVTMPFLYKEGIDGYGGYARLLASKGYIKPSNASEFKSLKRGDFIYEVGSEKIKGNEYTIEEFLEKYPELKFDKWPEYNLNADVMYEVEEGESE